MFDAFVSYSSRDRVVADAMVHVLEEQGVRCWFAPRNVVPGSDYADAIDAAIKNVKVVIFVHSKYSLESKWCKSEINLAVTNEKIIIPFKIDNSLASGGWNLYLANSHWIDAVPEPKKKFGEIARSVLLLIGSQDGLPGENSAVNNDLDSRRDEAINRHELNSVDAVRIFKDWSQRNPGIVGHPGEIRCCGGGFAQWFWPKGVLKKTNHSQRLFVSPNGECHEVHGEISRCYHRFNPEVCDFNAELGFPISEEIPYGYAGGGGGWVMQTFEKGNIVFRPDYCRSEVVPAGAEPSWSFVNAKPVAIKCAHSEIYVSAAGSMVNNDPDEVSASCLCAYQARWISRNSIWDNSWEKFFPVENEDKTWSCLSLRTDRYVSVQDDGTLKANATGIGPREKFRMDQGRGGSIHLFSVGANAYVEAYRSPPAQDRLLRADCRGREPSDWEEFFVEDVS